MKNINGINRWFFEIPLSDVQNEQMPETEHSDSCICCGKRIKEVKQYVHLLTNGNLVSIDDDVENSQGMFPIGNECKNRLPNNFYFRAT